MIINPSYEEHVVAEAIAKGLKTFYDSLLDKIDKLNVKKVMKRKNPYLYRAKAMQNAGDIITAVLNAYISSSEETIFGNCFFEPLAIAASGGKKSLAEGIDVEVNKKDENVIYAIAVKSGTSVFNADSKKKQEQNFLKAAKLAQQSKSAFVPIIGYGYGTKKESSNENAKLYIELAGQKFWTQLTGDSDFYLKISRFMGTTPEQYLKTFNESYNMAFNRLVRDFSIMFCHEDGRIDWEKLIQFVSKEDSQD